MQYTLPSRAIINILLPDLEALIGERVSAISPIVGAEDSGPRMEKIFTLLIISGALRLTVPLFTPGISEKTIKSLNACCGTLEASSSLLLCLISGKPLKVQIVAGEIEGATEPDFIIDILLSSGSLRLGIPAEFFRAFMRLAIKNSDPISVEQAIISFLTVRRCCFPKASALIPNLPRRVLEDVFVSLRFRGLFSPYQALLLIMAFPENAEHIKSALPQALVAEGFDLSKVRRLRINRRDLEGGVYSIDEALFKLLHEPVPPRPFRPFRGLRNIISELKLGSSFHKGDFWTYCSGAASTGELYEAVSLCGERTSRLALSGAPESFSSVLGLSVSGRAAEELLSGEGHVPDPYELSEARNRFASAILRARLRRISGSRTDLAFLLSRFEGAADFDTLLVETGWFLIATALKGVTGWPRKRLLEGIVRPARFLIEGVLNGSINPDILHDDGHVRDAGKKLSDRILELAERGLIRFSV